MVQAVKLGLRVRHLGSTSEAAILLSLAGDPNYGHVVLLDSDYNAAWSANTAGLLDSGGGTVEVNDPDTDRLFKEFSANWTIWFQLPPNAAFIEFGPSGFWSHGETDVLIEYSDASIVSLGTAVSNDGLTEPLHVNPFVIDTNAASPDWRDHVNTMERDT